MKKIIASILALLSVTGLSACSEKAANISETSQTSQNDSKVTKLSKTFAPIEISDNNVINSARVFDMMYEDNKQAMFSPLSLNMCLGMLQAGAAGSSKTALDNYLANSDYADFAADYLEHAEDFNFKSTGATKYKNVFELANSFWWSKDLKFNKDYKKKISDNFGAETESVDFLKKTAACEKINGWVNDKTNQMIPNIISEEYLSDRTAAVLVNTVYFESAWSSEWRVPNAKEKFKNADGSIVDIDLMVKGCGVFYENDKATAFSCGYKNGMKFIGILPKNEGDFTLESLDIEGLLKNETDKYDVTAKMPKLNFESEFPLTDALKAAGLSDIFDEEKADFTPMQGSADEHIYISEVMQKTKLELDEEGTRAAAVTAAIPNAAGAMPDVEREKKEVFLNRPFAFLIYDGEAQQIVFMGKVTAL